MPAAGIACPWCAKAIMGAGLVAGRRVRCPRCAKVFTLGPEDLRAAAMVAPVAARSRRPPALPAPPSPEPSRAWLLPAAISAAALLVALIAGVVAVVVVLGGRRAPVVAVAPPSPISSPVQRPDIPASAPPPVVPPPVKEDPPPPVTPPPGPDAPPPAKPPPLNDPPPELKPQPPPTPPPADLPPDMQDKVNKAIDRGVAFLRKTQAGDGSWSFSVALLAALDAQQVGPTSLAGLTLLECGVPPDDRAVTRAAGVVRGKAGSVQSSFETYEIALAILFLDRLGDPKDDALIRSMALRLTAGQTAWGGWTYHSPILSPEDEAKLLLALQKTRPAARSDLAVLASDADARKALAALPASLQSIPVLRPSAGRETFAQGAADEADNSNTQFVILAMWTARRHDVPTERVLALVDRRFRASQAGDGSWGYYFAEERNKDATTQTTPSMTAAGLLGLAVGHGVTADLKGDGPPRPGEDPAVEKGMKALAESIDADPKLGDVVLRRTTGLNAALAAVKNSGIDLGVNADAMAQALDLYYLWSVERVGVLFGRKTLGAKEWYPWGARLLTTSQGENGAWGKDGSLISSPTIDTCFALLFLKRANLVQDLSTKLEFLTEIKRPGLDGAERTNPKP